MAQDSYTLEETLQKLGVDEAGLRSLIVEGKLREFREAGKQVFRREDVDALTSSAPGGSGAEEILLEPADDSSGGSSGSGLDSMDLTGGGDLLSLAEDEQEAPAAGDQAAKKDDTVFTSIGVNVFEGEELELEADPAAKTVLSEGDSAPLSDDASGTGSGLLDLTRESDDTSLGAELLGEIYPSEGDPAAGDSTKAGLLQEMDGSGTQMGSGTKTDTGAGGVEGSGGFSGILGGSGTAAGTGGVAGTGAAGAGTSTGTALEEAIVGQGPPAAEASALPLEAARGVQAVDPYAGVYTGVLLISVVVLTLAGAVCAAFMRGAWPVYLDWLRSNLLIFAGGALGLTLVVLGVGFFLNRPTGPSIPKPKKEKKPKAKKEKKRKKEKSK